MRRCFIGVFGSDCDAGQFSDAARALDSDCKSSEAPAAGDFARRNNHYPAATQDLCHVARTMIANHRRRKPDLFCVLLVAVCVGVSVSVTYQISVHHVGSASNPTIAQARDR